LTATPTDDCWEFDYWSVDGEADDLSVTNVNVLVYSEMPINVTAHFIPNECDTTTTTESSTTTKAETTEITTTTVMVCTEETIGGDDGTAEGKLLMALPIEGLPLL
jgi:hypothetical protein